MAVLADLTEDERFLLAILQDQSGIDQAEFLWTDETSKDSVFRCWDFQVPWYRNRSKFQIDQAGRAVGKSNGIQMRAFSFPFTNPGEEMLLTAPELIHLDPITKAVEARILNTRITREFLKKTGTGNGIRHRPFEARFRNGSRVIGRIPQKDGKGVKGSVAGSTYISTMRGLIPAELVEVGDMVLTHEGRYQPVLAINTGYAEMVRVTGSALKSGVLVSDNHRFYGRLRSDVGLSVPTWVIASIEESDWTWASLVDYPALPLPDLDFDVASSVAFSWLCGYYWGTGKVSAAGTKTLMGLGIPKNAKRRARRVDAIKLYAALAGFDRVEEESGRVAIYSSGLTEFLNEHLSEELPLWVYGMAQPSREAFFEGLIASKAFILKPGLYGFDLYGRRQAVEMKTFAQAAGYNARISQGGTRRERWRVRVQKATASTRNPRDGVRVWSSVSKVTPEGPGKTYDFVVNEDASYVGDGLIHKGSTG